MKIEKAELVKKLNKIKGVVPKNATLPVLHGILVRDGYLIANNTEMTVKAKIEGAPDESFIIPERAFDLINNLPDGEIDISVTTKDTITIKADKIKNKYKTMDPDKFPTTSVPVGGNELTIKADTLLKSIKRVSYAISVDSSKPAMSSLYLQAGGGQLNFVGLDGHMVAWDKVDYDGEFELLIPKNTVDKLKTLGLSGEVQIRHSKTSAIFITDEFEVYTRLVEGQYFRYKSLFKELPLHTAVPRIALLDAMMRAKMCADERHPVRFDFDGNVLNLSIRDTVTDYYETVELQGGMEETMAIGFNARLVLETLKVFDCEKVGISLEGSRLPMIVEDEGSDFKAIVLPVALQ